MSTSTRTAGRTAALPDAGGPGSRLLQAALDLSPAATALVSHDGSIVGTNAVWRTLAATSGLTTADGGALASPPLLAALGSVLAPAPSTSGLEVEIPPDQGRPRLRARISAPDPGSGLALVRIDSTPATDWRTRLTALLDSSEYVVMLADNERRITYVNDYFRRLSGYGLQDIGTSLANPLKFHDAAEPQRRVLRDTLLRGESVQHRHALAGADGRTHHLVLNILPLRDAGESRTTWLVIGHEITGEVDLRERLTAQAHRLQLTLESARMGTWEVLESGEVIVDDSWLQLSGLSGEDRSRVGEIWKSRIHPADREVMIRRIENAIRGIDDVQTSHYRVQRPDGSLMWVQDTSRITEVCPDGRPARLVGVVADITELRDSIERAERSAERLWMATEAAQLGVWDHDLLSGSFYWNDRMRQIHGLAGDAESLDAYAATTHPDDRARVRALIQGARESGETVEMQFRIIRPDGEVRHTEVFARIQKAPDGRPCRAVGITRDITAQVHLAMEHQQALKLESVGRLAAGIAHEINTPLQYVSENLRFIDGSLGGLTKLLSELCQAGSDSEIRALGERARQDADTAYAIGEVPQAIAEALHGIDRITGIVRAMNTFSHPGNARTAVDLNKAIASTVTVASSEWKKVATLETDYGTGLPPVPVIPGEFNQVILNLLVNAAHAIAERKAAEPSLAGTIVVTTRQAGSMVEVSVADNGCGMSPEVQTKVFDPFFTTKPIGQGTGQGLALAHRFARGHHGSISFQTAPGQGSCFTLRLPLDAG